MNWKIRSIVFVTAAILVGAVLLRVNRSPVENRSQTPIQPPPQRAAAFVPPYYADVRGVQIPKTLPPEQFKVVKTRASYRVAGEIPQALMQLPCFCWCDRIDHKSLLDCFVDEHGEFCGICQDSALWADKRLREQASIETIRQEIVDRYSLEYGRR